MKFRYLAAIALMSMLSACNTSKSSLTYFEDIISSESGEYALGDYSIRLVPDDELLITVTSLDPAATAIYNLPQSNPAVRGTLSQTQPQQQTYRVDQKGDIVFPELGRIHVEGMTVQELTAYLDKRISEDVADPTILVELMNFRVSVLGEVTAPRSINIYRERYSVLDALADAGDLTPYGERSNVMIIREENGKRVYHRLNLNDSKTLESPYFYLQQHDVIMVPPNKIKQDNSKYNQNNAYKLSVISTITGTISIIASLVIALAIK